MFPVKDGKLRAMDLIKRREGFSTEVYGDSLGYATVGYGHLVLPTDGLKIGDVISVRRANEFFDADFAEAWRKTVAHLVELDLDDAEFNAALASANYQLGNFKHKFPDTFQALKSRQFDVALYNLDRSLWKRQTPRRVEDLTTAIRGIATGV